MKTKKYTKEQIINYLVDCFAQDEHELLDMDLHELEIYSTLFMQPTLHEFYA